LSGILVLLTILLVGCLEQRVPEPQAPIDLKLSFSSLPLLNNEVNLTLSVRTEAEYPNATLQIHLPNGFQLVAGNTFWEGDIQGNETKEVTVTVKAIETGDWRIVGQAISTRLGGSVVYGETEYLYVIVREDNVTVLEENSKKAENDVIIRRGSLEERQICLGS